MQSIILSAQLKEQTKVNHQLLEKKLVAQIRAIKNTADYTKLLKDFYGFYGGLELAIAQLPVLSFLTDAAERRKSSAIANDLKYFESDLPNLAPAAALPTIHSTIEVMGVLYVMEGSTIGGKFIAKMIKDQLKITAGEGFSFFYGYGDQTENMWKLFKASIDKVNMPATEKDCVIVAANDTFIHFSDWFGKG